MSFMEKLKINKRKLIVIISVVILCLAFGGVCITKYVNASQVKNELVLGNKYLEDGKYQEAILEFQKVIKIEPKNIEARVELAKAYIKISKFDEAEKILKEAIDINPKKVDPYLELAELYISENNPGKAFKILTDGYKATNDQSIKSTLDDLKSKITVDNINKTITLGESYNLPSEVTVKINNSEAQFPVKWDKTTVDVSAAGTQTVTGTLENADKTVTLTINVVTIASIGDINNSIKQNDKYSLPSKVTAKMTDNTTREVEVTWDTSTVDTSKAGTYTYQGTVSGYGVKVKLTLNVKSSEDIFSYIGLTKSQILNRFGNYDSTGTEGGSQYWVYNNLNITFHFPWSETGNSRVFALDVQEGAKINGAIVGMTLSEIKSILGPCDEFDNVEYQCHSLYYVIKGYDVYFDSVDYKNLHSDHARIIKK